MLEISQKSCDPGFGVAVLGQFRLMQGMRVVRVPRASQRLLAFLALRGRIVERAVLAGALWPEASEPHAYSSLRTALTRLQRTARMAVRRRSQVGCSGRSCPGHSARLLACARGVRDRQTIPALEVEVGRVIGTSAEIGPDQDWRSLVPHHKIVSGPARQPVN